MPAAAPLPSDPSAVRAAAVAGACSVVLLVVGCGSGSAPEAAGRPAPGDSSAGSGHASGAGTPTVPVAALVSTRLEPTGASFSRPASWHWHPLPTGLTPGPLLLAGLLTTDPADPCSRSTDSAGTVRLDCKPHLRAGELAISWGLQSMPIPMPAGAEPLSGRRVLRTSGPASAGCGASGGTHSEHAVLSGPADRQAVVEFVVDGCFADPPAQGPAQFGAMLQSLTAGPG
jgi:hypothetical protein